MEKKIIIEGMSCMHCVMHVKNALEEIEGVLSAKVDLNEKSAIIKSSINIEDEKIITAISDVGYEVISIM